MNAVRTAFGGGVAVVTGAASGIGEGIARKAALVGMKVVLADIDAKGLERVSADLEGIGAEVMSLVVDVSHAGELDRLAGAVHDSWGDVRLLVNNAGIETLGNAWEISAARWEKTLDVNLHGVIHGVRAFAPRMIASGKPACIANLASVGSFGIMPTQSAYILTKHAIQAFTECMYLEMQLTGKPVQVSSIIPGMVKTAIFDETANLDEPESARLFRKIMRDSMSAYGMELAEAVDIIFDKLAAGEFWVDTQPEITGALIGGRISYLGDRARPPLTPETRALLGLES